MTFELSPIKYFKQGMFPDWELFVYLSGESYCKKHFTDFLD